MRRELLQHILNPARPEGAFRQSTVMMRGQKRVKDALSPAMTVRGTASLDHLVGAGKQRIHSQAPQFGLIIEV